MKIYLAGPHTTPSWRENVRRNVDNHIFFSADATLNGIYREVLRDKIAVSESDMLIYFEPAKDIATITPWSVGIAAERNIPILFLTFSVAPSTIISGLASRIFTSMDVMCEYLRLFKDIYGETKAMNTIHDFIIGKKTDIKLNLDELARRDASGRARYA